MSERERQKLAEVQASAKRAAEEIERDWPQWKKDLTPRGGAAMTDDTTNEQHMARLADIIDDPGTNLSGYETEAVRWARDQVLTLRRERDEARATLERVRAAWRGIDQLYENMVSLSQERPWMAVPTHEVEDVREALGVDGDGGGHVVDVDRAREAFETGVASGDFTALTVLAGEGGEP